MTTTFKINDIVCFRAEFLRSISWYTDVPINGKVLEVDGELVTVRWCGGEVGRVRRSNLLLFSERHLEAV